MTHGVNVAVGISILEADVRIICIHIFSNVASINFLILQLLFINICYDRPSDEKKSDQTFR